MVKIKNKISWIQHTHKYVKKIFTVKKNLILFFIIKMGHIEENSLVQKSLINADAFNGLYSLYVKNIYCYLLARLNSKEEAEDLTSDVWEKVLNKLHLFTLNKGYCFRSWLFKIAHNTLIDHFRKNKKTITVNVEEIFKRIAMVYRKNTKEPKLFLFLKAQVEQK